MFPLHPASQQQARSQHGAPVAQHQQHQQSMQGQGAQLRGGVSSQVHSHAQAYAPPPQQQDNNTVNGNQTQQPISGNAYQGAGPSIRRALPQPSLHQDHPPYPPRPPHQGQTNSYSHHNPNANPHTHQNPHSQHSLHHSQSLGQLGSHAHQSVGIHVQGPPVPPNSGPVPTPEAREAFHREAYRRQLYRQQATREFLLDISLPHRGPQHEMSTEVAEGESSETLVTADGTALPVVTRRRMTPEQTKILEAEFAVNEKPTPLRRHQLAVQFETVDRHIQIWFQNRRAKQKTLEIRAAREKEEAARRGFYESINGPHGYVSPNHGSTPLPHSASGSGSNGTNSPPDFALLGGLETFYVNDECYVIDPNHYPYIYNSEGRPTTMISELPLSNPPPNDPRWGAWPGMENFPDSVIQIYDQQRQQPPPMYGGYQTGPGMGEVSLPNRAARRSSIANGEAANISTLMSRQGRSIGSANAARRGSIPYPRPTNSTMLHPASVDPSSPHQARRMSGHMVGMGSSPLSPQGSASQLAKMTLRNNSRRASMPVNNGSADPSVVGPSTTQLIGQSSFMPPRVVSGSPSTNIPVDGRVTRELSPVRGLNLNGLVTAPLIPTPQERIDFNFESIPEHDDSSNDNNCQLPNWTVNGNVQGNGNDVVGSQPMGYSNPVSVNGQTDVFGSYPLQQQYTGLTGLEPMVPNLAGTGVGPLPNPSFVFGDVHNNVDPINNLAGNFGLDESYLAMQERGRLNSMASIGTFGSEAPTEMSEFSGGFDYMNNNGNNESYDMYSRRSSAPAGLVNGLGMIGLNSGNGNGSGSGPGNQPIRPSPLGQTHSVSSDHLATVANGLSQSPSYANGNGNVNGNGNGYVNYNVGLGMPAFQGGQGYDQSQSQHQYQGQGQVPTQAQMYAQAHQLTSSPTVFMNQSQFQPQFQGQFQGQGQDGSNGWVNQPNPNMSYIPMSSRQTSNSTEHIFTPLDQNQQFPGSAPIQNQMQMNGYLHGDGNGSGSGSGSGSSGDEFGNVNALTGPGLINEELEAQLASVDWRSFGLGRSSNDVGSTTTVNSTLNVDGNTNGNVNGNGNTNVTGGNGNMPRSGGYMANDYLASLNYADGVINEEDEEEEEEEGEEEVKEGVQITYASDQVDDLFLEGQ